MSANDKQIAGSHYREFAKNGEQHWDRIWRLYGPGYFVGCITKYIERYPLKNGIQDLEKAKHFLEKLIELESGRVTEIGIPKHLKEVAEQRLRATCDAFNKTAEEVIDNTIPPMLQQWLDTAEPHPQGYVDQDR